MESWNHIIHTALLGTDKKVLKKDDLPAGLAEPFDLLVQMADSKEEAFLQTAALVYNYRQCGFLPLQKEVPQLPMAEEEEQAYASPAAHGVLADILEVGSTSLLHFWLQECIGADRIVLPEAVPVLLDAGMKAKRIREAVYRCCGRRGAWLLTLNKEWKYHVPVDGEEGWETGTLDQRKSILAQVREEDPARAREMLQQAWPQENAATRAELVQVLSLKAGAEDLPWLEGLLQEKSVKVRDAVVSVLKLIPSSSIVQLYWRLLSPSIELRKEKTLLGFGSKTVLELQPVKDVDEAIYKTGIEKMSSEKNVSDQNFLLYQLIMAVPPSLFESYTGLEKEALLKAVQQTAQGKNFIPAFGQAAVLFGDTGWLRAVMAADEDHLYIDALSRLPQEEAEKYAVRHLEDDAHAAAIGQRVVQFENEWSLELARAFLKHAAKSPYQYNRAFYNELVHLLPVAIGGELAGYAPKEEYLRGMWSSLSEHITKLISLKQQTVNAFKS